MNAHTKGGCTSSEKKNCVVMISMLIFPSTLDLTHYSGFYTSAHSGSAYHECIPYSSLIF